MSSAVLAEKETKRSLDGPIAAALRSCETVEDLHATLTSAHVRDLDARFRTDLRSALFDCAIRVGDARETILDFLNTAQKCSFGQIDALAEKFQSDIAQLADSYSTSSTPPAATFADVVVVRETDSVLELWRTTVVDWDTRWESEAVVGILAGIRESYAFPRFAILADALCDAGCPNEEFLANLRTGAVRESLQMLMEGCPADPDLALPHEPFQYAVTNFFRAVERHDGMYGVTPASYVDLRQAAEVMGEMFGQVFAGNEDEALCRFIANHSASVLRDPNRTQAQLLTDLTMVVDATLQIDSLLADHWGASLSLLDNAHSSLQELRRAEGPAEQRRFVDEIIQTRDEHSIVLALAHVRDAPLRESLAHALCFRDATALASLNVLRTETVDSVREVFVRNIAYRDNDGALSLRALPYAGTVELQAALVSNIIAVDKEGRTFRSAWEQCPDEQSRISLVEASRRADPSGKLTEELCRLND